MNEKMLNLLQQVMIRELAKVIKEKSGKEIDNTVEEVFGNLEYVYDEIKQIEFGQETGKIMKFMPKKYKEMVMRLISPTSSFSYKNVSNENSVTIEAFLFLDRLDEKPVSTGKATLSFSSISDESMSEYERKMYIEAAAKGTAESKALQKFGIGSWYSYQLEEDNPDILLNEERKKQSFNPTIASPSSATTETEPMESESLTETKTDKVENIVPTSNEAEEEQTTKENKTTFRLTLEEAKKLPADCGKAKMRNLTLGETFENYPNNLIWMYTNGASELNKEAILLIAKESPILREDFLNKLNVKL